MFLRQSTESTAFIILLSYFIFILSIHYVNCLNLAQFLGERKKILVEEDHQLLGGSLSLNAAEKKANSILMKVKTNEYDSAIATTDFLPAKHFFKAKSAMLQSKVYEIIRLMPKGGALHTHSSSITPVEFLINATYRPWLWYCNDSIPASFKFAKTTANLPKCKWESVATARVKVGAAKFDAWLHSIFSLFTSEPKDKYPTINKVWKAFENTFSAAIEIIKYEPVFRDYTYAGLKSFYDDNVQYMETRSSFSNIYLLNGTLLSLQEVIAIYQDVFSKFQRDYPDFSGAKVIYAPHRIVDNNTMAQYLSNAFNLQKLFPKTMAGFDLVGQEDLGPPLKSFLENFITNLNANPNMKYFFHAGETDWYGTDVDENLIDAILLNATRIGHGYALTKHPAVLKLAKTRRIPIEVCPISNQVLALVEDLRNHPAASLFSTDFPLVISSDDPGSWDTFGLSSDFYMAFMGLAGRKADLRTLKQLAINSIMFSAMDGNEKNKAMIQWQKRWDAFIKYVVEKFKM